MLKFSKEEKVSYLYLAVPLICVAFALFCIGYLAFDGWPSFGRVLGDNRFWGALGHNMLWMFWAITVPVGMGLFLATLISRNIKAERLWKSIIYLPALLSGAAIGLAWKWFFHVDYGVANTLIGGVPSLGPEGNLWVNNISSPPPILLMITIPLVTMSMAFLLLSISRKMPDIFLILISVIVGAGVPIVLGLTGVLTTSLLSILIASSWPAAAMGMVIFLTDMRNIPKSLLEAAKVDCASFLQTFRHVILPSLKSSYNILIVLSAIGSMKVFAIVLTLTDSGGGIRNNADVLALYVYDLLDKGQLGDASAAGFLGIIITIFPVVIYLWMLRRQERAK